MPTNTDKKSKEFADFMRSIRPPNIRKVILEAFESENYKPQYETFSEYCQYEFHMIPGGQTDSLAWAKLERTLREIGILPDGCGITKEIARKLAKKSPEQLRVIFESPLVRLQGIQRYYGY